MYEVPLYTFPSMLASAEFDSYAMGGGGSILGSGAIEKVTITSRDNAPFSESPAPEPGKIVLLIAGLYKGRLVSSWKRRRVQRGG